MRPIYKGVFLFFVMWFILPVALVCAIPGLFVSVIVLLGGLVSFLLAGLVALSLEAFFFGSKCIRRVLRTRQ